MRAILIAQTTVDLLQVYNGMRTLLGLDVRHSVDQSWVRNHPPLAAASILESASFISFSFLSEMDVKSALRLPNVRNVADQVWVVVLTLEQIIASCSALREPVSDDYLDFLRFVIVQLDILGYSPAIPYIKVTGDGPFYMRPK